MAVMAEPAHDPDAWSPEELTIMAQRSQLIPPNRRIAYETRLECLRLAVQTIGAAHPGDDEIVLRVAAAFEGFTRGMTSLAVSAALQHKVQEEIRTAMKKAEGK